MNSSKKQKISAHQDHISNRIKNNKKNKLTLKGHHTDHHLNESGIQNRPDEFGRKPVCAGWNDTCPKGSQISPQCKKWDDNGNKKSLCHYVIMSLCHQCWLQFCLMNEWNPDISYSANLLCIKYDINPFTINIHNIKDELGISNDKKYCHIARKFYGKNKRHDNEDYIGDKNTKANRKEKSDNDIDDSDSDYHEKNITKRKISHLKRSRSSFIDDEECDLEPANKKRKIYIRSRERESDNSSENSSDNDSDNKSDSDSDSDSNSDNSSDSNSDNESNNECNNDNDSDFESDNNNEYHYKFKESKYCSESEDDSNDSFSELNNFVVY